MSLKSLIPRSLKQGIRQLSQNAQMSRAIRLAKSGTLDLDLFIDAWGEDGFRATKGYLEAIIESVRLIGDGSVLEVGSGLSTIVLNCLTSQVWSLEHSPEFYVHTKAILDKNSLDSSRLLLTPVKSYGAFDWYEVNLDSLPVFDVVIADGPPAATKGGRYGLLPVMRSKLSEKVTILLDDAERDAERATLQQWSHEYSLQPTTYGDEHKWAVLTF